MLAYEYLLPNLVLNLVPKYQDEANLEQNIIETY
jgi:hypothetical protein